MQLTLQGPVLMLKSAESRSCRALWAFRRSCQSTAFFSTGYIGAEMLFSDVLGDSVEDYPEALTPEVKAAVSEKNPHLILSHSNEQICE